MSRCQDCTLDNTNKICSSGSIYADILLIGEAPGAEEAKKGEPFVGRSGKILRSILNYLDLDKERVYLTNMVMCRPPENRDPSKHELECCHERLMEEISCVKPKIIVTLGKVPGERLIGGKLKTHRGRVVDYSEDIKGMMTYHPAATLYGKGDTIFPYILEDIKRAKEVAEGKHLQKEEDIKTKVFIVEDDEDMLSLLDRMSGLVEGTNVAFDWETTGLSHLWDTGFCLGLSWREGTGTTIPIHLVRTWRKELAEVLEGLSLIGFNALLFDAKWNEKYGLPSSVSFDPMLYHALLDERPQRRSLTNLTYQYLNAPNYEGEMLAEYETSKDKMIAEVPPQVIYEYCAKDVDWTLRLANYFFSTMDSELLIPYAKVVSSGAKAFSDIMENGFWVDRESLDRISNEMQEKLEHLEVQIQSLLGKESFNPRSPQQIANVLWVEMGLTQPDIHGRDTDSVDKDTVAALRENYPDNKFLSTLADYRQMYTLYSRYVRDLPDYIEQDGRVRCNYHFDRAETGRLSTSDPSIHQIPRASDIRGTYSAPPGHSLVQADYEQIEMRMAAHIAQDERLTEILSSDRDFHSLMASNAYKVPYEEVTDDVRQAAKGVSFGLLYLMSDTGLIAQTGLQRDEAIDFVRYYKELTGGVQKWIERVKYSIRNEQYITSPFGRRRRFPLITDSNINGLYREGVNFPIQSGASDLTLIAVTRVNEILKDLYPEAKVVAMVHDSMIVECPDFIADDVADVVKTTMEAVPFETNVPFPAEVKIGRRWGE